MIRKLYPYSLEELYVVSVMPCYDKKLEAVRKENNSEVDTVLTTNELLELM
jgi:iron only hydrogenase large subunit-like protein